MVLVAISSCCLFLACEGEDSSDQPANPLSNTYWEMEYDGIYKRYLDFQDDSTVIYGDTGTGYRSTGTYKVIYDGYVNFSVGGENYYLRKATFTNRTLVLSVKNAVLNLDLEYLFFKK